jgi:tricorn protease
MDRFLISLGIAASCLALPAAGATAPASLPSFAQPALSPDGREIAFTSGGDLWTVPSAGGTARLLVSHSATEYRPLYSPDGRSMAFVSTRTGNGDLYVLDRASGRLARVTFDDGEDVLEAWSPDGKWLYFSTASRDIAGMNDLLRVPATGGTPTEVSAERYTSEFFAAPSPDGKRLALTARGVASNQWWRNGHSHLDESEIWLLEQGSYKRVVARGAKNLWPMWSPDGQNLTFVSDRDGKENLWQVAAAGGEPRELTQFRDGRLLWPSISRDGRTVVFERGFALWKLDLAGGPAAPLPITLDGAPAGAAAEHRRFSGDIDDFVLSPDGKKVAYTVRGEIFAASAKDGGRGIRVTETPAAEYDMVWAPDSRRLAYVSERGGEGRVFVYDFETNQEKAATSGDGAGESQPAFSPDGKVLAYQRGRERLVLADATTGKEIRSWATRLDRPPLASERNFAFSPDSRYVAVMAYGERNFRNAWIVPVAGGDAKPASFLANTSANSISWSPDGKFLLFDTSVRTEDGRLARLDLVPRTPRFREDQFRDLFHEAVPPSVQTTQTVEPGDKEAEKEAPLPKAEAPEGKDGKGKKGGKDTAPKPPSVVPDFDAIRQRLTFLPVGLDVGYQTISPDGKWVALIAESAGRGNLYVFSLDELAKEPPIAKQLSSTAGSKRHPQFSADSQEVFYLDDGALQVASLEGKARPLAVTAELDVDFAADREAVFSQTYRYLRDNFYDAGMHGVDWDAAEKYYAPYVAGAKTPDEVRRVISFMIGDLNASHSGIRAPQGSGGGPATGHLGLRFDAKELESSGRFKVREVIPLGPADVSGKIHPGDYLVSVNGRPLGAGVNLDQLLDYQIDRQVKLAVADDAAGQRGRREVSLRPSGLQTEKGLVYRAWVEASRAYVEKASGGRLGYVHLFDMSGPSLTRLYQDLDAANQAREGVVVDVRNNNGGFINVYVNDILSRRGYLNMTLRDFPVAPARAQLGQRSLERPSILITNQHSLSDAEDLAEGYRALGIGKIVGEPTAGWIIYTSNIELVDGSSLRIPFVRISDAKGENMELNPRPVDVAVDRPLGESAAGKDSQLDAAVRELLAEVGPKKPAS